MFITGKDKHLDKTSMLLCLVFFIEFIYIVVSQLFHIDFQFGESSLLYFILQIYLLVQYWIVNKHINNKLPKKTIENILYFLTYVVLIGIIIFSIIEACLSHSIPVLSILYALIIGFIPYLISLIFYIISNKIFQASKQNS